jgi:hypothetical protein
VRRDNGDRGAGRDVTCALVPTPHHHRKVRPMSRFVAPLTFTIAAAWVVVLFVLAHGNA